MVLPRHEIANGILADAARSLIEHKSIVAAVAEQDVVAGVAGEDVVELRSRQIGDVDERVRPGAMGVLGDVLQSEIDRDAAAACS